MIQGGKASSPRPPGVYVEEENRKPYRCVDCGAGFLTPKERNDHLAGHAADAWSDAIREGKEPEGTG